MPTIRLTPAIAGPAGLTLANAADADTAGHYHVGHADGDDYVMANTGVERLLILDAASGVNLTVTTPGTVDGLAVADRVVAIAAGGAQLIGPFNPAVYNDGDGDIAFDFSGADADVAIYALG